MIPNVRKNEGDIEIDESEIERGKEGQKERERVSERERDRRER